MTGYIKEIAGYPNGLELEWHISLSLIQLKKVIDSNYESPTFDLLGGTFNLRMVVPGASGTVDSLKFYLVNKSLICPVILSGKFELIDADGNGKIEFTSYSNISENTKEYRLDNLRDLLASVNVRTKKDEAPAIDHQKNLILYCKITGTTRTFIRNTEKLLQDLKELQMKQNDSDLKIRVKEKIFNLHRSILTVRAPFFVSLINDKIKDISTEIVDIDDFDFDDNTFKLFLDYVYTGEAHGICEKNIFDLYQLSLKYQFPALKHDCIKVIKKYLSIQTFFEFISFAEEYDEEEIETSLSQFCSDNLKELMKNTQWITYMKDNAEKAYEMLSRAIENCGRKEHW